MITYSIIQKSQLEGALRLDAEYYQPEYLEIIEQIKKRPHKKLGDLCLTITDGSHQTPEYQQSGIPFLMVKDILEQQINFEEDISFISEEFDKKLKHCKPKPGDILLTKVGSVGISAVVPNDAPSFNIFVSIAVLKQCKEINNYFLSTFLNSKFGRLQAIRAVKGISQPDLHLEDIREFLIPLFPTEKQEEISKLVEDAIILFKKAHSLYSQAENLLLEKLGLKDFKVEDDLSYIVNLSQIKSAHRADAEYFQPKYEKLIKRIEKFSEPLLKVVDNIPARFNPYLTPEKTFKYVELEHINTSIGIIDGYIEILGNEAPSRAKRVLKEKDVIFSSVEGSLKKVALVHKEQEGYLASTGFFQFRCKKVLPEYFLVLAKSIVLQMQFEKETTGTILTAVPKEALNNIIVPILPKLTQQKIADLVQKSHEARKKAKELLEEAKRKVEKLIEEDK